MHRAVAPSSGSPLTFAESDCRSGSHQPRKLRTRCSRDSREAGQRGQAVLFANTAANASPASYWFCLSCTVQGPVARTPRRNALHRRRRGDGVAAGRDRARLARIVLTGTDVRDAGRSNGIPSFSRRASLASSHAVTSASARSSASPPQLGKEAWRSRLSISTSRRLRRTSPRECPARRLTFALSRSGKGGCSTQRRTPARTSSTRFATDGASEVKPEHLNPTEGESRSAIYADVSL